MPQLLGGRIFAVLDLKIYFWTRHGNKAIYTFWGWGVKTHSLTEHSFQFRFVCVLPTTMDSLRSDHDHTRFDQGLYKKHGFKYLNNVPNEPQVFGINFEHLAGIKELAFEKKIQ